MTHSFSVKLGNNTTYSRSYYRIYYAYGSYDTCTCETIEDARIRKQELADNQIARGYTPENCAICLVTHTNIVDEKGLPVMETDTITRAE